MIPRRGRLVWSLVGILLLGLASVTVQADWIPHLFVNVSGGLNNGFDPTAIGDNEASDIQNFEFTTGGALSKRNGFTSLLGSCTLAGIPVLTGITFFKQSSGTRFLVATVSTGSATKVYSLAYGAGTTGPTGACTDITGSASLASGNDNLANFTTAQDTLIIEDGINSTGPYKWSGSGNIAAISGPPSSQFVEYHKNILWVAGDTSNPSRLTFSNISDINTWTGTDFLNIETNDGQIIRGIRSALDCLYIWKDESIWRVCGTNRDDFTQEEMVRGYGTLSNSSIAVINNTFYFVTSQGDVAEYDGGLNVKIISQKIKGTLTGLNIARNAQAKSVAFVDASGSANYYLAVSSSSSSTHDTLLIYNTLLKAWTVFKGLNVNAISDYEIGTTQKNLVFGDYAGHIFRYPNSTSDNNAAINAYYITKQYSFPDHPQDKTWKLLEIFLTQEGNYNLTVETRSDFESPGTSTDISLAGTGALWDTAVYDNASYADLTTTIGRIEVNKRRRFFQVKYSNNATTQPVVIKGWNFWIEPEGRV